MQNEDGKKSKKYEYEGPDPELAEMLERDVLERSPGVRWDDVAGLTQAKSLLEEALVLPLWIPEYFQVSLPFSLYTQIEKEYIYIYINCFYFSLLYLSKLKMLLEFL